MVVPDHGCRPLQAVGQRRPNWGAEPPVIRTDNRSQFTAHVFEERCAAFGLVHERIPIATPNMNGSLNRGTRNWSASALTRIHPFAEAYAAVTRWITYYNTQRLHGSLGYGRSRRWPSAWRPGTRSGSLYALISHSREPCLAASEIADIMKTGAKPPSFEAAI